MQFMYRGLMVLVITVAFSSACFGATLTVPLQYPTIQGAINAAVPGDVVLIQAGTYHESVTLASGVSLVGESTETVILGNGAGWATIVARNGESGSIENLSVVNDTGVTGTGIYLENCGIDLKNVAVRGFGNGVFYRGLFDYTTSRYLPPSRTQTIEGSVFDNNQTGITLYGAQNPIVRNNIFTSNAGSGIYMKYYCNPEISSNSFEGNGIGIYVWEQSRPQIKGNRIARNRTGIAHAWSSNSTIIGNTISENSYDGIYAVSYSSPLISNNLITRNGGDGLWMFLNWARIENNTIVGNSGDGISAEWYAGISTRNNIIAFNGGWGAFTRFYSNNPYNYGRIYLYYNDIFGNAAGATTFSAYDMGGNIYSDPLFKDMTGGNLQLAYGSPCIDAGDTNPVYNDPDGTRNDMGAYGGPNALPKDVSIEDEIKQIAAKVMTLPDTAFKNEPADRKESLEEKFGEVIQLIVSGNSATDPDIRRLYYRDALNKLEKDIQKKCDGFFGGSPKNDWITSFEAQSQVYPIIVDLKNEVTVLLNAL